MKWTPILLIRLIAALLCSVSILLTLLHPITSEVPPTLLGAILPGLSSGFVTALSFVSPLFIGATLWLCTSRNVSHKIAGSVVGVLILQTALALLISPELQFIVAVEAGLLLTPWRGAVWVTAQAAICWLGAACYPSLMSWLLPADGDALRRTIGIGLFMLIALLYNYFAFGLGWLAAAEQRNAAVLELSNRELQAAQAEAALTVRLNERLAIARELHDAIGHQLTALSLHLQVATHLSRDEAREAVTLAYELTGRLLNDVREVVTAIREPLPIDFVHALRSIASTISEPAIHLDLTAIGNTESSAVSHAILRCSQEIITNSMRHARASNLWIQGVVRDGCYRLTATDDGKGGDGPIFGNGLRGMEERVADLKGRMSVQTKPNHGFRVDIQIPVGETAL